jgi:hypothetical protein
MAGWNVKKKPIMAVVASLVVAVVAVPAYCLWDCVHLGPYVVRYNQRCAQLVKDRHLMGQTPAIVRAVLGQPTSIDTYEKPGNFTLNYAPYPFLPFAKFQAHFFGGKLGGTEMFDD